MFGTRTHDRMYCCLRVRLQYICKWFIVDGEGVGSWFLSVPYRRWRRQLLLLPEIVICVVNIKLRTINQYYLSQVILISSIRSSAVQEWSSGSTNRLHGLLDSNSTTTTHRLPFDGIGIWCGGILLRTTGTKALLQRLMYARLGRLTLLAGMVDWPHISLDRIRRIGCWSCSRSLRSGPKLGHANSQSIPQSPSGCDPPLLGFVRLITYTTISPSKVIVVQGRTDCWIDGWMEFGSGRSGYLRLHFMCCICNCLIKLYYRT